MTGRGIAHAVAVTPRSLREALRLVPRGLLLFSLLLPLAAAAGCAKSGPIEQRYVSLLDKRLWRAGVETWAPDEYRSWRADARAAADEVAEVEGRVFFRQDYGPVTGELRAILARGEELGRLVEQRREGKRGEVARLVAQQREKIGRLHTLSTLISVGHSYREAQARKYLTKADLLVCEAEGLAAKGELCEAEDRLAKAAENLEDSKGNILDGLRRFVDTDQIRTWRTRVAETLRESKIRGTYAIVVSKVDRKLVLYKGGRPLRTYDVGIGSGSLQTKAYAGDRATPEGRYRVVKKIAQSKFSKALLINYPNDDDLRQFERAKRAGTIPRRAGIGGLIEIHGGGREGMTYGCVALEDRHMDELYALVEAGTAVTIVGATDYENAVALAIRGL